MVKMMKKIWKKIQSIVSIDWLTADDEIALEDYERFYFYGGISEEER